VIETYALQKASIRGFLRDGASQSTVQKRRGEKMQHDKNAARLGASFF
jgi:hypothetical protein